MRQHQVARCLATLAVLVAPLAVRAQATRPPVPDQAFRTVHLVNIDPAKEGEFLANLEETNRLMAKLGCAECRYRLWKVSGNQAGTHQYMWDADWPGRAMYEKIHDSPEWKALTPKFLETSKSVKDEIYNRMVELTTKK